MIPFSLPIVVVGALLALCPIRVSAEPAAEIHARLRAAAIEVLVDQRLAGSGWLAAEPGYAFTASHVVPKRQAPLQVRLSDGRLIAASVRARDAGHDVVLLELAEKAGLPGGLPLADAPATPGDQLFLFGAPVFRHAVFLTGWAAREGTTFEWMGDQREAVECLHVVASTPKGVSGGPWVNLHGQVAGVQSGMILQDSAPAGIGWFGPASALVRLLASKQDQPTPTLGVAFEELAEQAVETIRKFPANTDGVILKVIVKNGPAEKAGLPAGCLAVSIDGQHPTSRDGAYRLIRSLPAGKKIEMRFFTADNAQEQAAEVVIEDWKEAP